MEFSFILFISKMVAKVNKVLQKAVIRILILLFLVLIFIVTLNVICRYILRSPLFWVTELSCYILVYLIFWGAALALYRGEHVGINITDSRIPICFRKLFKVSNVVFNYMFIVLLISVGLIVCIRNMDSYTGSLPISMGYVYMAAPTSGIFMLFLYTEYILLIKKEK